MLNSFRQTLLGKGNGVLSTGQVMDILKVTKVTLYKWIGTGRLTAIRHQIGRRVFLEFSPDEIKRLKSEFVKKREHGKPLLKSPKE